MSKVSDGRPQMSDTVITGSLRELEQKFHYRLEQKGKGVMLSSHEILGIVTEEYQEYILEVTNNSSTEMLAQELLDIAVAALFGVASLRSGETHW